MATNTTSETVETTTNNTSITVDAVTKEEQNVNEKGQIVTESDLDIENCECADVWRQIIDELESMKEYMLDVVERNPKIVNDALRILEMKNEETTREINETISDCNEGFIQSENSGCDSLHHHDL